MTHHEILSALYFLGSDKTMGLTGLKSPFHNFGVCIKDYERDLLKN